ncbi:MAG: aldo/keto reductase [Deltaproteobacteria bacterium]|nr:aldo/keto reductase [Deltaproteobacteria bacterium]
MDHENGGGATRRKFMQLLGALGLGGQFLLRPRDLLAAVSETAGAPGRDPSWPEMSYRTLGRTGHRASRLIFGCGAALRKGRRDELLNTALAAGVNVFDIGTRRYYPDSERNLAPFLKRNRDQIFLISKGILELDEKPKKVLSLQQQKEAAASWLEMLDESLADLGVDHVDAYYMMAVNNPTLVTSEEMYRAFQSAKAAGKVRFFGFSSHLNAQNVLDAAIGTGWYDLAMLAVTPAGWYDWNDGGVLENTPDLVALQPLLARARAAGIGLIGMKAGRVLASREWYGKGNSKAFDGFYDEKLLKSGLSDFQRSYAYVLAHGLDAVNADIQSEAHLKQNFVAAATSHQHFA